ncbi:MAG: carboxypeptidase-like regulatory domain-containing protein, partial [Sediminibacterium sp.]|nr:carboxypeptidase-like regulatory domain-containing protein [Sediminibacterium sp.]
MKDKIGFNLFVSFLMMFFISTISAQETVVKGIVVDSLTKRPLQGVSVYFLKGRGVVTDSLGRYMIITNTSINKVVVASVGFRQVQFTVARYKMQEMNVELGPDPALLTTVTVNTNKRAKYRNKDNPAVELIRNVIENRENNRTASYDYVEYEQYEKIQAALSNSNEKVTDSRFLKKYKFLFENRDSSK